MGSNPDRRPVPIRAPTEREPDDGVEWIASVLVQMFRVGIGLMVKRFPRLEAKRQCPKCGWRG